MKYLVAAVLLVSSVLAYPINENEGAQGIPSGVLDTITKSDESGDAHSHEQEAKVHSDVSHGNSGPKVQHDSSESGEQSGSSESDEKQEQAKPDSKDKPLSDKKDVHQAQPSEIINSEVAHDDVPQPEKDSIKQEQPKSIDNPVVAKNLEPVPQSDPVAPVSVLDPVEPKASDAVDNSEAVKPLSSEQQPQQVEQKVSDDTPKTLPEPEAPAPKAASDEQSVQPEIKQDAVVQSDPVSVQPKSGDVPLSVAEGKSDDGAVALGQPEDVAQLKSNIAPVDVVQPKSDDVPQIVEESKSADAPLEPAQPKSIDLPDVQGKAADDAKPLEEPKAPLEEPEKQLEDKTKSALPLEPSGEKASDSTPVNDAVVPKVVTPSQEVVADAVPEPQHDNIPAKEELPKSEPEPNQPTEKSSSS